MQLLNGIEFQVRLSAMAIWADAVLLGLLYEAAGLY